MAWAQALPVEGGLGPGQVKRFYLCKMGSATGTGKGVNISDVGDDDRVMFQAIKMTLLTASDMAWVSLFWPGCFHFGLGPGDRQGEIGPSDK